MNETQLIEKIKREFGWPKINVELDEDTIKLKIDQAIQKFIKHAVGQAKQETFFTFPVSAGVNKYMMPAAVLDVLDYDDLSRGMNHINTLFTVDSYLYSQGIFDSVIWPGTATQFSLVNYQIALDFLSTIERYMPSKFSFKYNYYDNSLSIMPTPYFTEGEGVKWALVRAYTLEGTTIYDTEKKYDYFYDKEWVFRYSVALCKKILGEIREKFQNYNGMGNVGISLNGSSLKSEASREEEELFQELTQSECWEGYGIIKG